MTLSSLIKQLQAYQDTIGDQEVRIEQNTLIRPTQKIVGFTLGKTPDNQDCVILCTIKE